MKQRYMYIKEEYVRYDKGRVISKIVKAIKYFSETNNTKALIKILNETGLYCCDDTNTEIEDAEQTYNYKQLRDMINTSDGCDYIFYIKNLTTGKIIYEDDQFSIEDEDAEQFSKEE